ncbi:MAG: hypothetical protein LUG56_03695 [Lachnospiraceae bacterium]|nr:hypothetical protein [Lachnospiraceae bacterium]
MEQIISAISKLSNELFSLPSNEDGDESYLFKLIEDGYDALRKDSRNRIDMIYNKEYYECDDMTKVSSTKIGEYYSNPESGFDNEIKKIKYFTRVLKSIKEELQVKDDENHEHPNANVYHAFAALKAKKSDVRFFELFNWDDIYQDRDAIEVLKDKSDYLTFTQALMLPEPDKNTTYSCPFNEVNSTEFYKFDCNEFDEKEVFNGIFDEYIKIIKKGKSASNKDFNGKHSLKELFKKCSSIKIPAIQRDYIQGGTSNAKDFLKAISKELLGIKTNKYCKGIEYLLYNEHILPYTLLKPRTDSYHNM